MNHVVLQKELTIPPVERLKRAFRTVKFLTDLDAHTLASDAYGILVKGLSAERANALQLALQAEGIETEIVAEHLLPPLPQTKFLSRLDCLPDGLLVYDPLNRSFKVEWAHVMLLAAGNVRLTDFVTKQVARRKPAWFGPEKGPDFETVIETTRREERNDHLLVEIILSRGVQRFSATADKFSFAGLGARLTDDLARNFTLLVQDLASCAPHAAINRGTYYLRENAAEIFRYPSKNAFFEEITWLLWQMSARPA